uniref:(northern house mosquito) hypothetical protein n=1 Tax=Culex pipiens TaxID=7175 RepID=A0A8D8CVN1_CULPI
MPCTLVPFPAVLRTAASRRPRCSTSTAAQRTIRPTCGRRAACPASPRTSTSRVVACRRSSGSRPARVRPPGPPTTTPAMDHRPTPGPRTTRRTASRRLARRAAMGAVPPPPLHPRRPSRRRHRSLQWPQIRAGISIRTMATAIP